MTKYGYIRVSTREQNEDRQRLAMAEAITASYDLSAREHIAPLVDCVTGME